MIEKIMMWLLRKGIIQWWIKKEGDKRTIITYSTIGELKEDSELLFPDNQFEIINEVDKTKIQHCDTPKEKI